MKVSVLLLAYNHEPFIAKSIESVLLQQVGYEFEIVIGEDFSTDQTREILLAYQRQYPDKIRLILSPNNLGVTRNFAQVFKACKGEYIATLEGDDYWTHPHKMQIQSDFLDSNPHFSMCFTNASIIDENDNLIKSDRVPVDKRKHLTQREIIAGYCPPANTVMFRKHSLKEIPAVFYEIINADFFLFSLITESGDAGYIDIKSAQYRMQRGGVWASKSEEYHHRNNMKTRMALLSIFKNKYGDILNSSIKGSYAELLRLNKNKTKNIVISGTNFWNPGDDFVRDGVIAILRRLFNGCTLNFLFYNFNADYFPQDKFSGIGNTVSKGDLDQYAQCIDAVVVAGLSAGTEIKDLYKWVIANALQDRVYLIAAGYENPYVDKYISEEPEATIFKKAKIITGRTRKTPKFIPELRLPYYHINCPAILSVDHVKNIPVNKKIERIAFSIQLPHDTATVNHSCHESMYKLAVSALLDLHTKYQVEVIAHHKSEYFHFLNLLQNIPVPVIFSSFYQDLYEIYPRYDLVVTTRLHSSLFANGYGIPGIILNDTDRHTHCLEGFPHSVWVNTREQFDQQFERICNLDLHVLAKEAKEFKDKLMKKYLEVLSKPFGIEFQQIEASAKIPEALNPTEISEQKEQFSDTIELANSKALVVSSIAIDASNNCAQSTSTNLQKELLIERNRNPIHFFTIVLNGEPFIRHHIEVFRQLPFKWHWHIIEGVADLKHDTAWSVQFGGSITDELHRGGLSNDGTTEYLDDLNRQFPENITIYRKQNGAFWDGKLEMVNAPLKNINEECMLWQVDADELWTVEQICTARSMFIQYPDRTAAYYLCHYFVGDELVITTQDTYGNNTSYEWLRTWRFKPGFRWTSHEPPRLCQQTQYGQWIDVATMNPFMHKETKEKALVFQHYAYVTERQVHFKEGYYGYTNASEHWRSLQDKKEFPVWLRDYFPWVKDTTQVNTVQSQGLHPVARKNILGQWRFRQHELPATEPKSILFVRTDSIGDNVLAASMLPHIRERYKYARITVACQEHIAELYEACQFVDNIICFNKSLAYQNEQYRANIYHRLKTLNPDLALNSVYSREPLTDALIIGSEAKERVAFHGNLCNISGELRDIHNQFYTHILPGNQESKFELERHKDFLKGIGIDVPYLQPAIWLTAEDEQFADNYFNTHNLQPEKTIALFAGAQCDERLYQQYGKALSQICKENQFTVLAFGTDRECTINQQNLNDVGSHSINLCGKTTLRQTAALLKRCILAVGAETGTAHISCAVGIKNVILLGGGHFGRFMPYSPLTSVVCLPLECYGCNWKCKYHTVYCIKGINPGIITKAVQQTLTNRSEKPRVFVQSGTLWSPQIDQPQWRWFSNFIDAESVETVMVSDIPLYKETSRDMPVRDLQQPVDILNHQAKQALIDGNTQTAKELLSKILNQSPDDVKALNNFAVTEILQKNWRSAEEILAKVLHIDPQNEVAHQNIKYLGDRVTLSKSISDVENLIQSGEHSQARELLEKILEFDDKHCDALNSLAVISILENSLNSARYFLEKVLSIDNTNEIAKENLKYLMQIQQSNTSSVSKSNNPAAKIDVSIVIATKNRARLLDEMLTSLTNAVHGINYEVIVIEGNSSDNTLEILRKHNIKQIYNETVYLGKGRHSWPQLYNFGFSMANGIWGIYASDDITFNEDCISKAVEQLNRQNAEVAGGIFFYKNINAEPGWEKYGIDFTCGQKLLMNYGLLRLEDVKNVCGLDEDYKFYCADGDICMKLYKKGKVLIPLPQSLVIHNNVIDEQKKSNMDDSDQDIKLYQDKWKHFVSIKTPEPRRLFLEESHADVINFKNTDCSSDRVESRRRITLSPDANTLDQLRKEGVLADGQPVRLHLGCGERNLTGYINIDYPVFEHTVQIQSGAEVYSDITTLCFPNQTVEEIRLHHVFEHFDRPTSLALLCKWNQWLKVGGSLSVETPDFEASMAILESPQYSHKQKQGVMRHIFGSHEAEWAVHKDGWYKDKFQQVLDKLGFDDIAYNFTQWQMTRNIIVQAKKKRVIDISELQQNAKNLLRNSMIDESASEERLWQVMCSKLDKLLMKADGDAVPKVSIFIPVYNGEKYLAETLDSILAQTFRDFEIVIADDGSIDKSLEIAKTYSNRDMRIRVLPLMHNGEVKARNEAIKHTNPNSTYLLNHDSDDISLPIKLEKLVEYLETHPEIAIVGCFAEYFDDTGNTRGQPPIEWQSGRIRETFGEVNSMINSAALIRREVFRKIGGYREEYRSVDDYDFFACALRAGFELANIPEILHRIRLHPDSIGNTRAKTQQILAEEIRQSYLNEPKRNIHQIVSSSRHEKPSILLTVEFYYPHTGGAETVVQQISERLAKRGYRVTVATTKLNNRNFNEFNGVSIEEFSIIGSLGNGIQGDDVDRYKNFLSNHSSDIMMNYAAQQWATDLAFGAVSSTRKHKVNIIVPCGYSALSDSRTIRWPQFTDYFNHVIPAIIPQYDASIYHSACYQDYEYARNQGFTNSIIIPNGVDEGEFMKPPSIKFREKYNIETPYFGLCVANYYVGKGQDRVIECVRQMKRNDYTMVFIGQEGDQLANLKALAGGMNIQFHVGIPREDTLAAFHEADLFIFGSYREASPLVIIEAKASKTPFISTDCGNVREWKGGIVCMPDEMAVNANKILDNECLRKQLVNEGWQEWKEKLTWESIIDKYENLYLQLYHRKTGTQEKNISGNLWKHKLLDIQRQIETNYADSTHYLHAAEILLKNGEVSEAKKYIEDALELDGNNSTLNEVYQQLSK